MPLLVVLMALLACGWSGAKRVNDPDPIEREHWDPLKHGLYVMNDSEKEESLNTFKEAERKDAQAGRNGTEVRKETVYCMQKFDLPHLRDSNVALEIGQLVFMAKFADQELLPKWNEIVLEHELEFLVAKNPQRAVRHYIQYNSAKPNKDPKVYGIDTVGLFMGKRGGWLSLPGNLECQPSQSIGDNCSWRAIRRVKSVHTACIMNTIDDGLDGTMIKFMDALQKFKPAPVARESFLDQDSRLTLTLFRKALKECPDVPPGQVEWHAVGIPEALKPTRSLRRCCCFNGDEEELVPRWVKEGVCLRDSGPWTLLADTWSMTRVEHGTSSVKCGPQMALYHIGSNLGRCLTLHKATTSANFSRHAANFVDSAPNSAEIVSFEHVNPSLVKKAMPLSRAHVCPAWIGMHHHDCDCSWAQEEC